VERSKPTWLGDGQTDASLPAEETRTNSLDQLGLSELEQRRRADAITSEEIPDKTSAACTRQLVCDNHLVKVVPLLRWYALDPLIGKLCRVMHAQQTGQETAVTQIFEDLVGDFLGLLPFCYVGHEFVLHPLSDIFAEGDVRFVEVGRVVL
jgi:hypothetical protein